MIKSVNKPNPLDDLEDRLMVELEDREEYGCWGGYCEGYCSTVYKS